jgi:hypothetical protein
MKARARSTYEIVCARACAMSVPGWKVSFTSPTFWIDLDSTCSIPVM